MDATANNPEPIECDVPPRLEERNPRGLLVLAFMVLGAVSAGAILFFFNPSLNGFYPICYFHAATGLHCPGCGALRAFHQLLHGQFLEALRCNALMISCLAVVAWLALRFAVAVFRRQSATPAIPSLWVWTFLCVAVAFTVLRNLPAFAWLAP